MAADKAKTVREVCKEELLLCIDEANEALDESKENGMKTVLRTLSNRRVSLKASYEDWNKACQEYSSKIAATIDPTDKNKDLDENVKPIRKTYLKLLDTLDEKIEELTKQENSESDKEARKQEIEIQIERKVKDIDNQIMNHHDRVCPAELSRGAKERLYNELDKDVKEPIEVVKKLYLDLISAVGDAHEKTELDNEQEKWRDRITKSILNISNKYTEIPESVNTAGDVFEASAVSSHSQTKASLKVRKADPPKFDGKIPSYPRFKKDFKQLMQDYDDSSQVFYIRNSLTSEDKNLIKTLDTMEDVWSVLDKKYKHSEVGANSLLETFADMKIPPGSAHTQFKEVFLKYKELKDGLESLGEIQYLKCNPAFRRVLLTKLPSKMRERFLEREARKQAEKEEKDEVLNKYEFMDEFMEYQFKISISVTAVDCKDDDKRPQCFLCSSVEHRKKDCPKNRTGGGPGRKFNAANNTLHEPAIYAIIQV